MKKIDNQLSSSKIEDIFNTCNSFSQGNTKKTISTYKGTILSESKQYDEYVPFCLEKYPLTLFGPKETDEIIKLYTNKLSKKKGREYYNLLISNAYKCPICGQVSPTELDHFIPKTEYPQLCITPNNLIPICHNCNFKKREVFSKKYLEMPLHPYFDDINEIWLECDIEFSTDDVNKFRFHCDNCVSSLSKKYQCHIDTYRFNEILIGSCCSEMSDAQLYHKELLDSGRDNLLKDIQARTRSCESVDPNSWKSALYRGLLKQFDDYCNYLRSKTI